MYASIQILICRPILSDLWLMTVFREYVEGRSQSGGEAIFEQKVEDMSTVQSTTTTARK